MIEYTVIYAQLMYAIHQ